MTPSGIIHLLSMIYLAGIICFTYSLTQECELREILKETLRRFLKFMGVAVVLSIIVALLD